METFESLTDRLRGSRCHTTRFAGVDRETLVKGIDKLQAQVEEWKDRRNEDTWPDRSRDQRIDELEAQVAALHGIIATYLQAYDEEFFPPKPPEEVPQDGAAAHVLRIILRRVQAEMLAATGQTPD